MEFLLHLKEDYPGPNKAEEMEMALVIGLTLRQTLGVFRLAAKRCQNESVVDLKPHGSSPSISN